MLRLLLAILLLANSGCVSDKSPAPAAAAPTRDASSELTQRDFILSVLRYLYRWHLDTATYLPQTETRQVQVWVRPLNVKTDAGDHSRFAELWLPGAKLLVELKQSNHEVPERNLMTRDSSFKIRSVEQLDSAPEGAADWNRLHFPANEVYAHLFQTRREQLFPDEALESRLKAALMKYLHAQHEHEVTSSAQTFYAAPISPVSNELWVFWENQQVALRFTTDGDLADPHLWQQQAFTLHEISLKQNVAVSPNEVPNGGKFVSRDWTGRLLYDCVVLGRKFTLQF